MILICCQMLHTKNILFFIELVYDIINNSLGPVWSISFGERPFKVLAFISKTNLGFVVELVSLKTA